MPCSSGMLSVSDDRHEWIQRSNDDVRALFCSSYLCSSVLPSFSGNLSLWYWHLQAHMVLIAHDTQGIEGPSLFQHPHIRGRDSNCPIPASITVTGGCNTPAGQTSFTCPPSSPMCVLAGRSWGRVVCLEPQRVDFH